MGTTRLNRWSFLPAGTIHLVKLFRFQCCKRFFRIELSDRSCHVCKADWYDSLPDYIYEYYLNHTIEGQEGYPGSIYTENGNTKEFTEFNTVIYGHDMKDGSIKNCLLQKAAFRRYASRCWSEAFEHLLPVAQFALERMCRSKKEKSRWPLHLAQQNPAKNGFE